MYHVRAWYSGAAAYFGCRVLHNFWGHTRRFRNRSRLAFMAGNEHELEGVAGNAWSVASDSPPDTPVASAHFQGGP